MLSVKVLLPGYKHLGTKVDTNEGRNLVLKYVFVCIIFFCTAITLVGGGERLYVQKPTVR